MAEAFTRKGWGEGVYRMIGSRASVRNRLNDTLYRDFDRETQLGTWDFDKTARATRFTAIMSSLLSRREWAYKYGNDILFKTGRHQIAPNRPYDWGNLVATNPRWFREWVNVEAPLLSLSQSPLYANEPGSALWYAHRPRAGDRYATGTGYVVTKYQANALCSGHANGCVGLTINDVQPWYIP